MWQTVQLMLLYLLAKRKQTADSQCEMGTPAWMLQPRIPPWGHNTQTLGEQTWWHFTACINLVLADPTAQGEEGNSQWHIKMYACCWAVCGILQQVLPSSLYIISPYYLLSPLYCISSSWSTGHFPPGSQSQSVQHWQNNTETLRRLGQSFAVTPSTNTAHEGSMWAHPTTSGAAQLKHLNSSDHLLAFSHARVNWCWFYCMGSLETP